MRSYQVKRERPTFKTAHDFHKSGAFHTDPKLHGLSGEEREAELQKIEESLRKIVSSQFPRTQNLEYAILKAHLIAEYAITQYIRYFAAVAVSEDSIRFTFSQKLEIAYLLGFGANNPILLPTIERLNKIRNQVAHTFHLDRAALDEMLRINSNDYDEFKLKSDRERIRHIRAICNFICGRVAGEALGAHVMATLTRKENGST
jgi:hypothetical protein